MNQLPIDVQLIVYKYLHVDTLTNTHHDMMNQLRSECPYLKCTQQTRCVSDKEGVIAFLGKYPLTAWKCYFDDWDWYYPFWYFELSDYLKKVREHDERWR